MHGGTGASFDWGLLAGRRSQVPMVLAGGLTPENVAEAIGVAHPYAVDVVTGVEAEPGRKDHAKVEAFIEAAKAKERRRMSAPRPRSRSASGPTAGASCPRR